MSVLKKKYEANELKHDDHQLKIAQELQRIYEQVHTYQPPDIIPTSSNENILTKWLPFMSQPKNRLDPSKRLQGLYIYGSVGGGKTMLMDMFFDCCENVSFTVMLLNLFLKIVMHVNKIYFPLFLDNT